MKDQLGFEKIVWKFFCAVLGMFFLVSVFWVIKYWDFMPYVDESLTVSAIQNMITEGLPRVGVARGSVMFDLPPEPQYYWTYFVEILIRIPLQIVGGWLELDNIQAVTNLCFTFFLLFCLYDLMKKWQFHSVSKEKDIYLLIITLTLLVVMCSEGFMSFAHYVRYYNFAMMSFLLSVFAIPVYMDCLVRGGVGLTLRNVCKIVFMGIMPCIFHLSFIPYCFLVILVMLVEMISKKMLERKVVLAVMPAFLIIAVGFAYILSSRKTDLLGMIHMKIGHFIQYIANIVSLDIIEIMIAVTVILVHMISYARQPAVIKKLVQLTGINIVIYMFVVGSGTYTSARYCWSLRISYIVLTVTALLTIAYRTSNLQKKLGMGRFFAVVVCTLLWGIFSKGNFRGYTMLPLVSWQEFYLIEGSLKAVEAEQVVVFADCSLPVNLKHPKWYAYLFRNYNEIDQAETTHFNGSINYYKNSGGDYFTVSNQAFAGKKKDVDRILERCASIEDKVYLVFWKCDLSRTDKEIQNFFADLEIDTSKPICIHEFKNIWEDYFES